MPQLNSRPTKEKGTRNANDPNFNWRGIVLCVVAILLIGGAFVFKGPMGSVEEIPLYHFNELLAKKEVVNDIRHPVEVVREDGRPTQWVKGYYQPPQGEPVPFRTQVDMEFDKDLQSRL